MPDFSGFSNECLPREQLADGRLLIFNFSRMQDLIEALNRLNISKNDIIASGPGIVAEIARDCKSIKVAELLIDLYTIFKDQTLTEQVIGCFDKLYFEAHVGNQNSACILAIWCRNIPPLRKYLLVCVSDINLHDLKLLQDVYIVPGLSISPNILSQLWQLLTDPDDAIAEESVRVLILAMKNGFDSTIQSDWWNQISQCFVLGRCSIAYRAWLSWVDSPSTSEEFYHLLNTNEYWRKLKNGICKGSTSYEQTKYSLEILSKSLLKIRENIDTEMMFWDCDSKETLLSLWNRFIALVKMTCIDTSFNQTRDSKADIVFMQLPECPIPAIWATALLRCAFTSSMDTVKNFVTQTILEFNAKCLTVFNNDIDFVTQVFLPYILQARYFGRATDTISYEDKLSSFFFDLIKALSSTNVGRLIRGILKYFTQHGGGFEAPKIIVVQALSRGTTKNDTSTLESIAQAATSFLLNYGSRDMAELLWSAAAKLFRESYDVSLTPVHKCLELLEKIHTAQPRWEKRELEILAMWIPNSWGEDFPRTCLFAAISKLKNSEISPESNILDVTSLGLYLSSRGHSINFLHKLIIKQIKREREHGLSESSFELLKREKYHGLDLPKHDAKAALWQQLPWIQFSIAYNKIQDQTIIKLLTSKGLVPQNCNAEQRSAHRRVVSALLASITPSRITRSSLVSLVDSAIENGQFQSIEVALSSVLRLVEQNFPHEELPSEHINAILSNLWSWIVTNGEWDHVEQFISLLTHNSLLFDEDLQEQIEKICMELVSQSYGRRGILAHLSKGLHRAFCTNKYQARPWMLKVLAEIYTFVQNNHNAFNFQTKIGQSHGLYLYDGVSEEKASRILVIDCFKSKFQNPCSQILAEYLLTDDRFGLLGPHKTHASREEQVRISAHQLLLLLEQSWSNQYAICVADLLPLVFETETSPYVRIYAEWTLARIILRDPVKLAKKYVFDKLITNLSPRKVSSYGRVGLLVLNATTDLVAKRYVERYLQVLIPLSTSNSAPVRHFAVAMLSVFSEDLRLKKLLEPNMISLIDGISKCASKARDYEKFKHGQECIWNVRDMRPAAITGGIVYQITGHSMPYDVQSCDYECFFGNGDYGVYNICENEKLLYRRTTIRDSLRTPVTSLNIQTKSTVDDAVMNRTELIVVASLCDRLPNLGGICRVCDTLGAKLVTFNDLSVVNQKEFKSTAVTADKWMPMLQVPASEISSFMRDKKRQGYTLFGLEQTDNSHNLTPDFLFPRKSLVLLGKEREGIPGELLAHLDNCIEIEQYGMVRSMNIQTAAAIFVHAYNVQHQR